MTSAEKIQKFRKMSKEELRKIARDNTRNEEDIIIASIELGRKEKKDGNYFTTEQVLENIFGRNYMVNWCTKWFDRNL